MGSAVEGVLQDILDVVVAVVVIAIVIIFPIETLILAYISRDFESFISDQFATILSIFGIVPEDLVAVNVHSQLLFENNTTVPDLLTQIAITNSKTGTGILSLLAEGSNRARAQYHNYYRKAKYETVGGLPTTNIMNSVVPKDAIKAQIDLDFSISSTLRITSKSVPTKYETVYSYLYKTYGYSILNNRMVVTAIVRAVNAATINYNYLTDQYDMETYRPGIRRTNTVVTISPIYTDVGDPPVSTHTADNVHTVVTVTTIYTEETIVDSITTTDEEVAIGSVLASDDTVDVEGGTTLGIAAISVAAAPATLHYIASFYTSNQLDYNYWIYELGSGIAALDDVSTYITDLDMMPVVSLRNNSISVTADPLSNAYLDAKNLLGTIGITPESILSSIEDNPDIANIESAYVHFGVDPTVVDPDIAKALFLTFDYVYTNTTLVRDDVKSYSVVMKEGDYNASLLWRNFTKTTNIGVISTLGQCTNEVVSIIASEIPNIDYDLSLSTDPITNPKTISEYTEYLRLRKQVSATEYEELLLSHLVVSTFISNGVFSSTTSAILAEGAISIPISKFILDKLTPLEQTALFTKSLRLSIYSLNVTHLDYYQTEAFANALQIVIYIIAIVVLIFTWYTGPGGMEGFLALAQGILYALAASYAFKLLLESTDNVYLKALYTVLYVAAMVYRGGGFDAGGEVFTITNVLMSVNAFTQTFNSITMDKMSALDKEIETSRDTVSDMNQELQDAISAEPTGLDTDFVVGLISMNLQYGTISSVDAMMYQARDVQFDAIRITVSDYYTNQFDYDKYYDTGL